LEDFRERRQAIPTNGRSASGLKQVPEVAVEVLEHGDGSVGLLRGRADEADAFGSARRGDEDPAFVLLGLILIATRMKPSTLVNQAIASS
jgi:hypothetical protein